jgi:hypothetical protein
MGGSLLLWEDEGVSSLSELSGEDAVKVLRIGG